MRWLAAYLRQVFCKHDFEKSEIKYTETYGGAVVKEAPKVSLLCTKCGYHRAFWKF